MSEEVELCGGAHHGGTVAATPPPWRHHRRHRWDRTAQIPSRDPSLAPRTTSPMLAESPMISSAFRRTCRGHEGEGIGAERVPGRGRGASEDHATDPGAREMARKGHEADEGESAEITPRAHVWTYL